jgi:hypothetical protein
VEEGKTISRRQPRISHDINYVGERRAALEGRKTTIVKMNFQNFSTPPHRLVSPSLRGVAQRSLTHTHTHAHTAACFAITTNAWHLSSPELWLQANSIILIGRDSRFRLPQFEFSFFSIFVSLFALFSIET